MTGQARRRLALALLCLALALFALWRVFPAAAPASGPATQDATAALDVPDTFLPGLDAFGETVERPLFVATRTPRREGASPPGSDGALLLGRYRFVGAVSDGETRLLLLRDGPDGALLRVRPGDRLGELEVRRIETDSLTVARDGRERTVPLRAE